MKLWPVAPFFPLTFGIGEHTKHCSMSFLYSSTRNDMLQCFVCSLIPKVSEKKGQYFTNYRIGTLGYIEKIKVCSVWLFDMMKIGDLNQGLKSGMKIENNYRGWKSGMSIGNEDRRWKSEMKIGDEETTYLNLPELTWSSKELTESWK